MIFENISRVRERIRRAAEKSGRNWEEVKLVAVVKNVEIPQIREAISYGIEDLGENRAQDLLRKLPHLPERVNWHFVGHLQTNKVKQVVRCVSLIHSVDSLTLLQEIDRRAAQIGKKQDILIQVNVSAEKSKFGIRPEEVLPFIKKALELNSVKIRGLMTIGPLVEDPEDVRPVFIGLREIYDRILQTGMMTSGFDYLSMGMTNDFEVAVEEGANIVRIGTAIFRGN